MACAREWLALTVFHTGAAVAAGKCVAGYEMDHFSPPSACTNSGVPRVRTKRLSSAVVLRTPHVLLVKIGLISN